MKRIVVILAAGAVGLSGRSGRTLTPETQLKRSCTRCHGLNVVRAQRLAREEWERELDKMIAMGAKVADRDALATYLAKRYGNRVGDLGEGKK